MAQVKGLTVKVTAAVLGETDVRFCQALDEPARRVFQELLVLYRSRGDTFVTYFSGPRLVLQACQDLDEADWAKLSPVQFQWMVTATNGHAPVVDAMIQKRLGHILQGKFSDARALTGEYSYDTSAD